MNLEKIWESLWARITESKWTVLYISVAALQMIVVIVLEGIIFSLNEDIAQRLDKITTLDEISPPREKDYVAYTGGGDDYGYKAYLRQFQSIVHSNIWFMVFQAFVFALCVTALVFQNTIEIIVISAINILLTLFAAIQIFQSNMWLNRVNKQFALDNKRFGSPQVGTEDLDYTVRTWELILTGVLILFSLTSCWLGYKLYQHFGWNIYKKIGANIQMQKMFRTYLLFIMLLKLDVFLLMGFQILNLVFLFQGELHVSTHTKIFQGIMVAFVIPMVVLAWWGVRQENIPAMFIFTLMAITSVVNLIYILAKFTIGREENLLTLLDILGILLCIASIVVAYLAVRNFENGLKDQFHKQEEHNVDLNGLENASQNRKQRYSIDD